MPGRLTIDRMMAIQYVQDRVYEHYGLLPKVAMSSGPGSKVKVDARDMMVGVLRNNVKCTLNDLCSCTGTSIAQTRASINNFNDMMDKSLKYAQKANEIWKNVVVGIEERGLEGELL